MTLIAIFIKYIKFAYITVIIGSSNKIHLLIYAATFKLLNHAFTIIYIGKDKLETENSERIIYHMSYI